MPLPTLRPRVTALAVTLLSFGGTDWSSSFRTYRHNFDLNHEDAKSSNMRYASAQPTKRKRQFTLSLFQDQDSTHRATNLSLSAWTLGGNSRIADIKHCTLTTTTLLTSTDGSGAADFDEYPVPRGTDIELQVAELVSSNADLIAIGSHTAATSITDFEMTVLLTIAGLSWQLTMLMSAGSLQVEGEQIQMQDVTFRLRGVDAAPELTLGSPEYEGVLFQAILTGSAQVTYSVATGSLTEVGYALITKATLSVQDSKIVMDDFDFVSQGLSAAS